MNMKTFNQFINEHKEEDKTLGLNINREDLIDTLYNASTFEIDQLNQMSMSELKSLWDSLEIDEWQLELAEEDHGPATEEEEQDQHKSINYTAPTSGKSINYTAPTSGKSINYRG